MSDYLNIHRETVVDIEVSLISADRNRWVSMTEEEADPSRALQVMKDHKLDVLPIVSGTIVREYFVTDEWNVFGEISRKTITNREVIQFESRIRDVIRRFATEDRKYFFLVRDGVIVGLVTIADLNRREVRLYLSGLLCEIENRLGIFVSERVPEDDMLDISFGENESQQEEYVKRKIRFLEDRANGVNADFVEYLPLFDLINIAIHNKLHDVLGRDEENLREDYWAIEALNKAVNEPDSAIIEDTSSVSKLWNLINLIESALFNLRILRGDDD